MNLTAAAEAIRPMIERGRIYDSPSPEDVIVTALPHILEALAEDAAKAIAPLRKNANLEDLWDANGVLVANRALDEWENWIKSKAEEARR